MNTTLLFPNYLQLLGQMGESLFPSKLWARYHSEYQSILCQICIAGCSERAINMSQLITLLDIGSQPTVTKRVNELISLNLIETIDGYDGRVRSFKMTVTGQEFIQKCSQLLLKVAAENEEAMHPGAEGVV